MCVCVCLFVCLCVCVYKPKESHVDHFASPRRGLVFSNPLTTSATFNAWAGPPPAEVLQEMWAAPPVPAKGVQAPPLGWYHAGGTGPMRWNEVSLIFLCVKKWPVWPEPSVIIHLGFEWVRIFLTHGQGWKVSHHQVGHQVYSYLSSRPM